MKKTLKCEFFEIEAVKDSTPSLDKALQSLLTLNSDSKNLEEIQTVFRMDPISGTKHRILGDLVRIRMNDLPEKCNMKGKKEPLSLEKDEGLGESNAFMIDSDRRILAIQKNKFGVSPGNLCKYIFEKTNRTGAYNLLPILSGSGLAKLRDMSVIRKIEIRLAKVASDHGVNSNHSISQSLDILKDFGGAYINLTLSMSHKPGSMDKGKLMRTVRGLIISLAVQKAMDKQINVADIRVAARNWYQRSKEHIVQSRPDALKLLKWIISEVIGHRQAHAFLLGSETRDSLINYLYDNRVLHIIKSNIAGHDMPGEKFNVYSIDYGCYVDLINTTRAPKGLFQIENEGNAEFVEVPENDYRSIRRSILDLSKFYASV